MSKFILIDNSIEDTSGHHYQYAMYCLKAAKELGYEPILATNKKNIDAHNLSWKTFPVYSGTFWNHEEHNTFLTNIYSRFEKSQYKKPISLALKIFSRFLVRKLLDKNKINEFCINTKKLFNEINLTKNDIVFIPTSGLVELFGIAAYAQNNSSAQNASWNFLFRRNIHTGSTENYSYIYIKLRLLKKAFDLFLKMSKFNVKFYTDSEYLSKEYNMINSLKIYHFLN